MRRGVGGFEHAIVIGGGIAGLLSAAILARHYARVTLFDRDALPSGPEIRAGAPQGHHVHVLLTRGWRLLDELFPGLDARLLAAGAKPLDWIEDVIWETPYGRAPRVESELRSRLCSRALLEHSIRAELLAAGDRVRILEGYEVAGLQAVGDPARVVGVVARGRHGHDAAALGDEVLKADLVVDTSGRGSKAPTWLEALGYETPPETIIDARLGYSSRIYRRTPDVGWRALYVMNRAPDNPQSGVIYEIEDDRWQVTLVGYNGRFPPTDEDGFLEFARGLANPAVYEALVRAEPLSKIHGYRRTANRVRHFERLRRWPAGFLVLGDACCALNPVYGQGMSVAAIAASILDETLRQRHEPERLGPIFQRRLGDGVKGAFTTATSDDLRWPETSGKPPPGLRLMHGLVDRVIAAATQDPRIHVTLMEVLHMIRPTSALLRPRILGKALAAGRA